MIGQFLKYDQMYAKYNCLAQLMLRNDLRSAFAFWEAALQRSSFTHELKKFDIE